MAGADEVRWARRVRQETIRRLYTLDAKGIVDEELIDEVGYAIFARCHSIRTATRAHAGKAMCPRCRQDVLRSDPDNWKHWRKEESMRCACGWETTWADYHRTYKGKQLHGGGAYGMFRGFIDQWPAARTSRDKMLAIDALIHACHGQFRGAMGRPAACNLIEGTAFELITFLNELAYGDSSTTGLAETHENWLAAQEGSIWVRTKIEPTMATRDTAADRGEGQRPASG